MIRKFQRQDLEAAVKIWLAANKEAHDFIDPCYWEGYKDAVKEMFLQAEIYVFETEDMMEEIFDETGGILGFIEIKIMWRGFLSEETFAPKVSESSFLIL